MFEERVSGKYIMTHIYRDGEEMTPSEVVGLLNHLHQENNYLSTIRENQQQMILKLKEENEQLQKEMNKYKPSIYNKKEGDWKWNVNNNTILNIRTNEIFHLRNSGGVENLVALLNKKDEEIEHAHQQVLNALSYVPIETRIKLLGNIRGRNE